MAADDHAADLGCFGKSAAQNRRHDSWPNEVGRKADDVECSQWTSAHGEDVGERVSGCDRAVRKRVVHDWREEIDRLNKSAMPIETVHASVVERFRAHEHISV